MPTIRPATKKDLKACHKLACVKELRTAGIGTPPLRWLRAFLEERQIFLVAEEHGKVVGFLCGERITGNWAFFWLMAVQEGFRGKGIGKMIFSAAVKECRKRKLGGIVLYAPKFNKRTQQFYEKLGFERGFDMVEFVKRLD